MESKFRNLVKSITGTQERIRVLKIDIDEDFYEFVKMLNEINLEEEINFLPMSLQFIIEEVREHYKNRIIFRDHAYPKNTCGLVKGKYSEFTEYCGIVNVYITPEIFY